MSTDKGNTPPQDSEEIKKLKAELESLKHEKLIGFMSL